MGYYVCSMSNDEYKTSLLNYRHFHMPPTALINNYYSNNNNNNNNLYPAKFQLNPNEKDSSNTNLTTTPTSQKTSCQNYHGSENTTNNNNNNTDKRVIDCQFVPMNVLTNTALDLSHSIVKSTTTFEAYFNNNSLFCNNNNNNNNNSNTNNNSTLLNSSPCSSESPSIDVENDDNDDCADRIMSPVSIPSHHLQKPILKDTRNTSQSAFTNMELAAGSIPTGFPLNFQQLYANNAALYGAPVMFSGAIHAAHASYMSGLPLHATLSPNETYLKAIQAAACGIYSPTALAPPAPPAPPPPPPPSSTSTSASVIPPLIPSKPTALHNPARASMVALAPTSQSVPVPKSPHPAQQQQYSPNIINNNITDIEQQQEQQLQQQQKKKDYRLTSIHSQTAVRTNSNNNNNNSSSTTGTYLNDKVNERLTGVAATNDTHFKVPNGKEGSLKHRILRPSSNNDNEQTKIPVMRSYSSSTNFKRGNYIELANGTLRRVEDMRTEDFIQCAERSPNHQLAESTVVKINTSLPTTAVITFSYDKNRSKVDMEVSLDHPFFVYGQGWASCNPEMSMKMYGLKCQRLQVGDICISLRKREPTKLTTQPPPAAHTSATNSLAAYNDTVPVYQTRHTATIPSTNTASLKVPTLPALSSTGDMPYSAAHTYSIAVPQPTATAAAAAAHHLQQQQLQHHQVQQQAYAEMAKLMSSYAYAKGLPQLPHEQHKEVAMDTNIMQSLSPKMVSAFYQNQIFQLAQHQHQQQEHLRQHELKSNPQRALNHLYTVASHSPQPPELTSNHMQQQPPQTQPLDVTMSRKRRWSAPENMFDDLESETQPPRNGPSPSTART